MKAIIKKLEETNKLCRVANTSKSPSGFFYNMARRGLPLLCAAAILNSCSSGGSDASSTENNPADPSNPTDPSGELLPAIPGSLRVTGDFVSSGASPYTAYETAYTLSWNTPSAATPPTRYEWQWQEQGAAWPESVENGPKEPTEGPLELEAMVSDQAYGNTYEYRVRSCNDAGCSPWSAVIGVEVKQIALSTDKSLSYDGIYTLSWDTVAGATRYEMTENGGSNILGASFTATSMDITQTDAGSYEYSLKACNAIRCGPAASVSVMVFPLAAPTNLSSSNIVSYDGTYTLSWNRVSGATRYEMTENGGSNILGASFTDTSKDIVNTMAGAYSYSLRTCAGSRCGPAATVSVAVSVLAAPTNLRSDESTSHDGMYTLMWDQSTDWDTVTGATFYEMSENGGPNILGTAFRATSRAITQTSADTYTYSLQTCAGSRCGPAATVSVMVSALPAPTNLESSGSPSFDGTYTLSWNAVTGATRYEMTENGGSNILGSSFTGTSRAITKTATGAYTYSLRACAGTFCGSAATLRVMVSGLPAPTNLSSDESPSFDGTYTLSGTVLTGQRSMK